MTSSFKKSLLVAVVAVSAQGTMNAENCFVNFWRCLRGSKTPAAAAPIATAAVAAAPIATAAMAAVPAATSLTTTIATGVAAGSTAAATTTIVENPGKLAAIATFFKTGLTTAWGYTLGSLWNMRAQMDNPVVNKLSPAFYTKFATNDPFYTATALRVTAKLAIATAVVAGTYYATKALVNKFSSKPAKKNKNKTTTAAQETAAKAESVLASTK